MCGLQGGAQGGGGGRCCQRMICSDDAPPRCNPRSVTRAALVGLHLGEACLDGWLSLCRAWSVAAEQDDVVAYREAVAAPEREGAEVTVGPARAETEL